MGTRVNQGMRGANREVTVEIEGGGGGISRAVVLLIDHLDALVNSRWICHTDPSGILVGCPQDDSYARVD
jgi:hypothetical protein